MNVVNMKFSLGDRAFVVRDDAVFSCEIRERYFTETEDENCKRYEVERVIPRGLFDEETSIETYDEEKLFLDKKEAKEFLSNLKEARKVVNEYGNRYNTENVGGAYGTSILDLYRNFTNNK